MAFTYSYKPVYNPLKMNIHFTKITGRSTLVFFLIFTLSCASSQKTAIRESYPFEVRFGSTGGFSNINPIFSIRQTGEVLKKDNSSSEPYLAKKITKQQIDSLYQLIRECNFSNLKINRISNYTHYIEIQTDQYTNKVMWFNDSQIPDALKKLYNTLINTIKN
jgi:hypothetical protein